MLDRSLHIYACETGQVLQRGVRCSYHPLQQRTLYSLVLGSSSMLQARCVDFFRNQRLPIAAAA